MDRKIITCADVHKFGLLILEENSKKKKQPSKCQNCSSNQQNTNNNSKNNTELNLPSEFTIAKSHTKENSFFDSFRQGLHQLEQKVTVEQLRNICKDFAQNNAPAWFLLAIKNSYNHDNSVRRETAPYTKTILKKTKRGDPEIEGRVLCGYFNVTLFVAEKKDIKGKKIYTYQEINTNSAKTITKIDYQKSNAIFMVNQGYSHFEPILFIPSISIGTECIVGSTPANADCFYDSLRQALQQIGRKVTVKFLRNICKEFAQNNPPLWFVNAINNNDDRNNLVKRETTQEYIKNIVKSTKWGDPDVEGRILCGYFSVTLYVAKLMDETYKKINQNGSEYILKHEIKIQNNTILIIHKTPDYFEPVLFIMPNNGNGESNISSGSNMPINGNVIDAEGNTKSDCPQKSKPKNKNNRKNNPRKDAYSKSISVDKSLVFKAFSEIENAIQAGNLNDLKNLINSIYMAYDKTLLSSVYYENGNPIRNTHLITLACKYEQPHILDFLLNESDIMHYLPNKGIVVEKAYKQALRETMMSYNIKMLEMLYDYWSGEIHWPISDQMPAADVTPNLKLLKKQLIETQKSCQKRLEKNPQMSVNVHCLISFNSFQIELYNQLYKLRIKKNKSASDIEVRTTEVEAIKNVILNAFSTYEKYTNKNIRLTKDIQLDKDVLEPLLQTDISVYMKYLIYCMYETYYRKMDYNISLLIINNLHLLKQRLNMPKNMYENIESTLYYFLYRVNENWRLYLPENRTMPNTNKSQVFLIDGHRLYNSPVIYFEWIKFKKSLDFFINTLKNVSVKDNLRSNIPKDEINSLQSLPYMRDDYSLKKIVKYMGAISKVNFKQDRKRSFFIVQRVINVIGEFMKNTKESCHVSLTTKALLQAEISKSTIKLINNIRHEISHAREGKLLKRINLENTENIIFEDLIPDLLDINKSINEIVILYKPILEKTMIQTGLQLLTERFDELPTEAISNRNIINDLYEKMSLCDNDTACKLENEFLQKYWYKNGFTRQLFREIFSMKDNLHSLNEAWCKKEKETIETAIKKVPKYTNIILKTLNEMEQHNNVWSSIKEDVTEISIINHPNKEDIQKIQKVLKTLKSKSVSSKIESKLETLKDWSNDWNDIINIFNFLVVEVDILREYHWKIKPCEFKTILEHINRGHPDADGISSARRLIQCINEEATKYCQNQFLPIPEEGTTHEFKQITLLANKLDRKLFITKTESDYLRQNIRFSCTCTENTTNICTNCQISQKIQNNETLSVVEYKKIKSLNVNEKCRKTVENLVIGQKRDSKFLECLVNRTEHLDELLEGCRDYNLLVSRYKYDESFRIVTEILIADIMNILQEGWLKELVNVRFSKMLSELPLRNILVHGNPHLEVIGSALDSNDLPGALISFALNFIKDETYLKDLLKLYEQDVDRNDVQNSTNLNSELLNLANSFKKCPKWKSYIKLLPNKQVTGDSNKNKQFRTNTKNQIQKK